MENLKILVGEKLIDIVPNGVQVEDRKIGDIAVFSLPNGDPLVIDLNDREVEIPKGCVLKEVWRDCLVEIVNFPEGKSVGWYKTENSKRIV